MPYKKLLKIADNNKIIFYLTENELYRLLVKGYFSAKL